MNFQTTLKVSERINQSRGAGAASLRNMPAVSHSHGLQYKLKGALPQRVAFSAQEHTSPRDTLCGKLRLRNKIKQDEMSLPNPKICVETKTSPAQTSRH